jgi:hypothetical protein
MSLFALKEPFYELITSLVPALGYVFAVLVAVFAPIFRNLSVGPCGCGHEALFESIEKAFFFFHRLILSAVLRVCKGLAWAFMVYVVWFSSFFVGV